MTYVNYNSINPVLVNGGRRCDNKPGQDNGREHFQEPERAVNCCKTFTLKKHMNNHLLILNINLLGFYKVDLTINI